MRTVTLMMAVSLDGYIADPAGGIAWLPEEEREGPDSYGAFIRGIDTVVMGWNTYHQVVTELSPNQWPYEGLECLVATHRRPPPRPGVRFFSGDLPEEMARLKRLPGRGIWICGGADVVRQLLAADLIDRLDLSVAPTALGDGIRLFPRMERPLSLRLEAVSAAGSLARLVYWRVRGIT